MVAVWYRPEYAETRPYSLLERPRIVSSFEDFPSEDFIFHLAGFDDWRKAYLRTLVLPCGKCQSCRLKQSGEWVARNLMESRYHDCGCFLTLTVNDSCMDSVFPFSSLSHYPFQCFMKRVRKAGHQVRYMMCGEYGDQYQRPHYHVLLYGYDFPDRVLHTVFDGHPVFTSTELSFLWPYGFHTIEELNTATISYVCRYVLKKRLSRTDYGDRLPEYVRMSIKPGLGAQWFKDFGLTDIYSHGSDLTFDSNFVYLGDFKIRPPRYFDKLFSREFPSEFGSLVSQRISYAGSLLDVKKSDLARAEDYLKTVTQGRLKKGVTNV